MINWQSVFDQMEPHQRARGARIAAEASAAAKRTTGRTLTDEQFYQTAVWNGIQASNEEVSTQENQP